MNFEQNIRFTSLRDEANKTHEDMLKRLDGIDTVITDRLGGRTGTSVWGAIALSALYTVGAVPLSLYFGGSGIVMIITLIVSVLFFGTLLLSNVFQVKYYGTFLRLQDNLHVLRDRITTSKTGLMSKMDQFNASGSKGWDLALEPAGSVYESASTIESQLKTMEYVEGGLLTSLRTALYYVAGIVITGAVSMSLIPWCANTATGIMDFMSYDLAQGIMWVCLIAACIVEGFLLAHFWSSADCRVNNANALAVLLGPLVYLAAVLAVMLVIGLVALVVMIVVAVVKIVLYIVGIGIAAVIAGSSLSGG